MAKPRATLPFFTRARTLLRRIERESDKPKPPLDIGTRLAYDRTMMAWVRTGEAAGTSLQLEQIGEDACKKQLHVEVVAF
jgi:uncharacterized membrane protein YidH (DUF202 family)